MLKGINVSIIEMVIYVKLKRLQRLLIYIISGILAFTIMMVIIRQVSVLNSVETKIYSVFSSVKYTIIDHPIETIVDWVDDYTTFFALKAENDALYRDIESLNLYKAQLMESNREIDELKAILELKQLCLAMI